MIRVASSDGIDLAVHDLGGKGRRVLAAHATGFHGRIWSPVADLLHSAHVVAPDFRGHGDSTVPDGYPFEWERFADDVLATLAALGWDSNERPVGVGHSMGGAALLMAELRRPGTFAALWVFEPIVFPPEARSFMGGHENPLSAGARRRRARFDSLDDAILTYGSKPPMGVFTAAALQSYVHGGFEVDADGAATIKCRPENEARVYETASTCTAFERLGAIGCPTTILRGAMEEFGPSSVAPLAADLIPHGRLEPHDDLNHFGPMVDPAAMSASIKALLDSTK